MPTPLNVMLLKWLQHEFDPVREPVAPGARLIYLQINKQKDCVNSTELLFVTLYFILDRLVYCHLSPDKERG